MLVIFFVSVLHKHLMGGEDPLWESLHAVGSFTILFLEADIL